MKIRTHMLFAAALAAATPAASQQFPSKPIRFVIPFAAGGPNDLVARIVGPKLNEALGVPIVIDNRAGAGGNIGTSLVAKAAPDCHTIVLVGMHFIVNPMLYEPSPYDPIRDM